MTHDCVFCAIIEGQTSRELIWEGQQTVAFHDAYPVAPRHVLVVPRVHVPNLTSMLTASKLDVGLVGSEVVQCAEDLHFENGFRMVVNQGSDPRQSVFHLHYHLLGRRSLDWPPG